MSIDYNKKYEFKLCERSRGMTILQARIILKKRQACEEECKRAKCLNDNSKRCSICPYHTSLDDYIAARLVVSAHAVYRDTDALYYTEEIDNV